MEGRNEIKKGNRRIPLTNRTGKRLVKMKKYDNQTHTSEKKNFSSRNINKIIKNVKMQDQKRKNTLKYSDHSLRSKQNEYFLKRIKQKKLLGDLVRQERVSHTDFKRRVDTKKRQKKRIKTKRMFTQEHPSREYKEDSIDLTKNKKKQLEKELSMSDDMSEGESKQKIKKKENKKELELKLETPNSNTRKKGKFQLSNKNKSHSKFGFNPYKKERYTAKAISKYRLTKTPQGKNNLSNHQLIHKEIKGNRKRIKTFAQSPMLESDGFKRSHRKTRLPKSTRNVPKTSQTFFANSTNNIPLISDLIDRPIKKESYLKRHAKKSKSKSNAGRLTGLNLRTYKNKKKASVLKNKKTGLNRTYAHETKATSGISLGHSQVSSKNKKNTSISNKFQSGVIPSPLSRQPPKNIKYAYAKNNKLGKSQDHTKMVRQSTQSPDFIQNDSYQQVHNQPKISDPGLVYNNEFYPIEHIKPIYNYQNQRISKNSHSNAQPELYLGPNFDYKIYSNKNLQKSPVIPLNINQGNWHSQRNSHPNMIEFIRVPIQSVGNYPDEDNKLYFQKSNTQGSPHNQMNPHMSSFGEFPNQQYTRFIPSNVGSKQFIESRDIPRNSHQYYERMMMSQGVYDIRDYQRAPINIVPDNQRYFMVRQGSEGTVWIKNSQEQMIKNSRIQKQSK
jgi:hypothetical protein